MPAYTWSELEAACLLQQGRPLWNLDPKTPHEYANEVIALAERIKADRAAMTMELAAQQN